MFSLHHPRLLHPPVTVSERHFVHSTRDEVMGMGEQGFQHPAKSKVPIVKTEVRRWQPDLTPTDRP